MIDKYEFYNNNLKIENENLKKQQFKLERGIKLYSKRFRKLKLETKLLKFKLKKLSKSVEINKQESLKICERMKNVIFLFKNDLFRSFKFFIFITKVSI